MGAIIPEYHEFLNFLTMLHSLNKFSIIYRQIHKFELQLCYSLVPKFCKHHKNAVYNDCT